jgi:phosphoribosyl 1,2-cyclic phosphate phosphodiesterase
MRFLFMGTGTSSGIPAIGCECAVCTSDDPRDNRLRTCAAFEFTDAAGQHRTILLDSGPDLRQQALRFRLKRCDAILYTHNHVDHVFGLDEVRRFNVVQDAPIEVFAEAHTMEHLRTVYRHIFERSKNVNDSFVANLIPRTIDADTRLNLFGMLVTPIRLLHGRLPVLGYRIEPSKELAAATRSRGETVPFPLAYCTDVSGIPPESWKRLTGLRTLVLDALRDRKHPTHFTLDEAVGVADQVGADQTYFVHMAHDLGHAETTPRLPERMSLAWDGLVLE